ncbi:MAG: radical SAM protein [Thermofilum sp.]|jgi:radical SAM superfamily enzyme with C-terminal helix-hairpin-helix motif|nr:radical SAM protein [Thermofilum sp.]
MTTVVLLDGYNDEPAGLGVPPYIDIYPRYMAGAVWSVEKTAAVHYFTIDQARNLREKFFNLVEKSDLLVVFGGITVPGKYLGGTPITLEELTRIPRQVTRPRKILLGPLVRFGFGKAGGEKAIPREEFLDAYDLVAPGDPWLILYEYLVEKSLERIDRYAISRDYTLINQFAIRGARIVLQHPNLGYNLTAEIETYKSCPRWVTGGCSFCIEPRFGKVVFREPRDIGLEVRTLYELGVRGFRLGRQADLLAYKARGVNEVEFPEPDPEKIKELMRHVRCAAPSASMLHIDNVNPATIYLHKEKAREALREIVKYHSPGDVAALGLESADPVVSKVNNLGNDSEGVLEAVRMLNEVGAKRGWNGSPELLPGINFVLGLPGETAKTFKLNKDFLLKILEERLLVRRVNIREVMPLPGTPMWSVGTAIIKKNRKHIKAFKKWVRLHFDRVMLRRVYPSKTIVRDCYVERTGRQAVARPMGSYPITIFLEDGESLRKWEKIDCIVAGAKSRSLKGVPLPIKVEKASLKTLRKIFGDRAAASIKVGSAKAASRDSLFKYLESS